MARLRLSGYLSWKRTITIVLTYHCFQWYVSMIGSKTLSFKKMFHNILSITAAGLGTPNFVVSKKIGTITVGCRSLQKFWMQDNCFMCQKTHLHNFACDDINQLCKFSFFHFNHSSTFCQLNVSIVFPQQPAKVVF